jgi:glycosyltransferase involved in cell wall biosynthesis
MFVSVIIPTYNRVCLLKQCIESVLQQSLERDSYEIIVVDDGSRDETYQGIKQYRDNSQFRYFYQSHRGVSTARNLGIKNALGEVLVFLDDDCLAGKQWIEEYVKVFQQNKRVEIMQGPYFYTKGKNFFRECTSYLTKLADLQRVIKSNVFKDRMEAKYVGTGNFAIRRSTIINRDLLFDEDLFTREDEDYFRRIDKLNIKIVYLRNPVLHITHFNPRSEIRRYFLYGRGEYILQKKWGEYVRLRYDIPWKRLREKYRPISSIIMLVIFCSRELYWNLGFLYQRLKDQHFLN